MTVLTFEGVVEAGQIRLLNGERLPERATVYIVVPNPEPEERQVFSVTLPQGPRVASPRLVSPGLAQHFVMEVTEAPNARL